MENRKEEASRTGDLSPEVLSACAQLQQGDLLDVHKLPLIGRTVADFEDCPEGVVLLSQTCDIVQGNRPNVLVAKVVSLTATDSAAALRGSMPRFVHVPNAVEPTLFVDLEYCATVSKSAIVDRTRILRGVDTNDHEEVSAFAARVARRFSRFPFPDDVQPSFRPLQREVRSKYQRQASPLGRALRRALELRIEADDWFSRPLNLTIHMIVASDAVPSPEEIEFAAPPAALIAWMDADGPTSRSATEVAERLVGRDGAPDPQLSGVEKYYLWAALAEAVAGLCSTAETTPSCDAVTSVTGQLSTEEEFSLRQYRRSESLDLEDLSHGRHASFGA